MKFLLNINKEKEPTCVVTCKEVNDVVLKIEELCKENSDFEKINGYLGDEIAPIIVNEVSRFFTYNGKVYASVNGENYLIKLRIKDVEDFSNNNFVKINQGCVVNVKKIKKFKATIGGSLAVIFDDGGCDYVSRRELKNVKRRFGL